MALGFQIRDFLPLKKDLQEGDYFLWKVSHSEASNIKLQISISDRPWGTKLSTEEDTFWFTLEIIQAPCFPLDTNLHVTFGSCHFYPLATSLLKQKPLWKGVSWWEKSSNYDLRPGDFLWIITHVPLYQRKSEFQLECKAILPETVGWKRWDLDIRNIFISPKNLTPRTHKTVMKYIRGIWNFILALMGGRKKKRKERKMKQGEKQDSWETEKRRRNLLITGLSEQDIFLPFTS